MTAETRERQCKRLTIMRNAVGRAAVRAFEQADELRQYGLEVAVPDQYKLVVDTKALQFMSQGFKNHELYERMDTAAIKAWDAFHKLEQAS